VCFRLFFTYFFKLGHICDRSGSLPPSQLSPFITFEGFPYIIFQVLGWKENEDDDDDEEGSPSGTEFTDVDLTEKEWADYDERSGESTVISEVEVKFVTVK